MRKAVIMLAMLAVCACQHQASSPAEATASPAAVRAMSAARAHLASNEQAIVEELRDLLAAPNVASDREDIHRNAEMLVAMLDRRGARAQILETPDAPVSVYGEIAAPGATRTILFYAHFDGQPVGDLAAWATPPFEPTLRLGRLEDGAGAVPWAAATYPLADEARIYARSSSDDKSPIIALMAALDALRATDVPLSANIKFFLEGEEEAGSPNLARTLALHRERLASDLWVFADGPIDPRGLPRVLLGVRGVVSFRISVFGAASSLHSGHYGNVAPNPGAMLAHLIASMRGPDRSILIDGFPRQAPSADVRALAREAFDTQGMLDGPQIAETESGLSYGESVLRPALNVTQLSYGGAGPQRNAIDPVAAAGFDIRLTPGIAPDDARRAIEAHLRQQGFHLVEAEPSQEERRTHRRIARFEWNELGYPAAAVSLDEPSVRHIVEVVRGATNNTVRVAPLLGGSLPIAPISDVLGAPFVIVPMVNADNNQHAPNENVRMREFRRGVELYAAILADGGRW